MTSSVLPAFFNTETAGETLAALQPKQIAELNQYVLFY